MTDKIKQVLFRADASQQIGGGHVIRCLTLANVLSEQGWDCTFAVNRESILTVPNLTESVHKILILNCDEKDEPEFIRNSIGNNVDVLVVDHYDRSVEFEKQCKEWSKTILVLDDLANREHFCDLLLDPTYQRTKSSYISYVESNCRLLLGTGYALLRPEFSQLRKTSLTRRYGSNKVRKVLVSMGLTDPVDLTSMVLSALKKSNLELDIDVVLGANAPYLSKVREQINHIELSVNLHVDTDYMDRIMLEADIAIGASGSTSWERCCVGLPSLLCITADNQIEIAKQLSMSGAAMLLGEHDKIDSQLIARKLCEICENTSIRQEMTLKSSEIIDGLGVFRVVKELSKLVAA